jgi:SAM-dependent methyltransferase
MAKSNVIRTFRNYGLWYSLNRLYQVTLHLPIRNLSFYIERVSEKHGLEVGGPSAVFATRGLIPLYEYVGSLDNCNFGSRTLWATHDVGRTFRYSVVKPAGKQLVAEGADLAEIPDESYDFILSSHMLEHSANPLRALQAWKRVLRPGGSIVLLLPNKRWTFDHSRPVTTLTHLVEDFEGQTSEDDLTHLPEVLRLHDLRRDPDAGEYAEFKKRSENNPEHRGMHHHVFDEALVRAILERSGFSISLLRTAFKDHIVAVARKMPGHFETGAN